MVRCSIAFLLATICSCGGRSDGGARTERESSRPSTKASIGAEATDTPRPNFLIILCDDLGYGDLGCYDHPSIRTPHLDQLASEGMRLTSCYSSAPVCSPSRVGLLTGRTPNRAGVYDYIPHNHFMHLGREETTIAHLLQGAGYDTAHFGKWHCNGKFNSPEQPQPGDHGFDEWFSTQNNAAPSHENPKNFVRNGSPVGPLEGYACRLVAGEAIDWLEERPSPENPFFLFVCFHEPHEPVASPKELTDSYPEAKKRGEALYYANVTNMDRAVGDLMRALDEQGLTENTLVFFTSDNGPETLNRYGSAWRSHGSPGPLRGMKLWLYEGGIRVPGIVRWPARVEPGQTTNTPVCGLDVFPTFCELAGLPVPDDRPLDGSSVVGLLDGEPVERETPLYWHYYSATDDAKCAMRVGDWMILGHWDGPQFTPGGQFRRAAAAEIRKAELTSFELYNVQRDPAQKMDLAAEEPERLRRLSAMLVKKYREIRDDGPDWGPSTQR